MSGLGSRVLMTHRCTTMRQHDLATDDDSWGQGDASWSDLLTDQPCLGWFVSEQLVIMPGELVGVVARHLALPLGSDVARTDRMGDVTYRGDVVMEGPMTIDELITWPDRIELVLRRAD